MLLFFLMGLNLDDAQKIWIWASSERCERCVQLQSSGLFPHGRIKVILLQMAQLGGGKEMRESKSLCTINVPKNHKSMHIRWALDKLNRACQKKKKGYSSVDNKQRRKKRNVCVVSPVKNSCILIIYIYILKKKLKFFSSLLFIITSWLICLVFLYNLNFMSPWLRISQVLLWPAVCMLPSGYDWLMCSFLV